MNKKKIINVIKYIVFLSIGVGIFWWIYKDQDLDKLMMELKHLNYWWIALSFVIALMSHFSRAIRWRQLIESSGDKVGLGNTFMSVLAMYMTNLVLPRAGEVARCTLLSKYEKVSFTKLVGTAVIERIVDTVILVFLLAAVFFSQFGVIWQFLQDKIQIEDKIESITSGNGVLYIVVSGVLVVVLFFFLRKKIMKSAIYAKVSHLFKDFSEGFKAIRKVKNKPLFIFHSLFIYVCYLFMMYVVIFSYEPTSDLKMIPLIVAFVMGGLGMLAPVQSGIGPWHYMVIQTLAVYGLAEETGEIFALIVHTSMNLMVLVAGLVSVFIMSKVNKKINPNWEVVNK